MKLNHRGVLHRSPARLLPCICLIVLPSLPVHATVIEFDRAGNHLVAKKPTQLTAVNPSELIGLHRSDKSEIKDLVRAVATRFSGDAGVRKAGLDALTFINIFEALIEAESSFDPSAVSPKGAQGLGQLMPGTASDMEVADPFDPAQNLVGSARYLTQLLNEFGSLELALAAYNAGPERVRQHKGVPPFRETQIYVAKVLKAVGLSEGEAERQQAQQIPLSMSKEHPLKGQVSVWEF